MTQKSYFIFLTLVFIIGYIYSFIGIFTPGANPLVRLIPFIGISVYANFRFEKKITVRERNKPYMKIV